MEVDKTVINVRTDNSVLHTVDMTVSIVIPTLNEATNIEHHLLALQTFRANCEIIIADGGSQDATTKLAKPLTDKIIDAPKGRARQMNAGVQQTTGDILLFLHADTYLPKNALSIIRHGIDKGAEWGRFDIQLSGGHPMLKLIALMMSLRSRLTGISTGDQALFVTRKAFDAIGHFPDIPLMEDITLCKNLKHLGKPLCLKDKVLSSARRWEQFGVFRTILLMWWLRLCYFFGRDPEQLVLLYSKGKFWKP